MISIKIWKNPEHYRPVMGIISTGGEGGESVGADLSYLQFQGTVAPHLPDHIS